MSSIEYINSLVLSTSAASVTFSNIPQHYQDLIIILHARSTSTNSADAVMGTINSDNSNSYSGTRLFGDGSSAGSNRASNASTIEWGRLQTSVSSNTSFSVLEINIFNYINSEVFKNILTSSTTNTNVVDSASRLWRSTSPINTLFFSTATESGFIAGSTFTLWGVR